MLLKPMDCKLRQRCVPLNFQQRLTCAVQHHADLTAEQIAAVAQIPHSRLLAYCTDFNRHIPFVVLLRVVRATGRVDLLSEEIRRELNHVVVPAPGSAKAVEALVVETLDVAAAVGALASEVRAAAPGGLDPNERAAIVERLNETEQQLGDVRAALASEGKPVSISDRRRA